MSYATPGKYGRLGCEDLPVKVRRDLWYAEGRDSGAEMAQTSHALSQGMKRDSVAIRKVRLCQMSGYHRQTTLCEDRRCYNAAVRSVQQSHLGTIREKQH